MSDTSRTRTRTPQRRPRRPPGRRAPARTWPRSVPFITRTLHARSRSCPKRASPRSSRTPTRSSRQVGIEFREAPDALQLLKRRRLRRRGRARPVPARARSRSWSRRRRRASSTSTRATPRTTCEIGGDATVLAPAYGSPFVRDLDGGRRYGTIEDFRNFVKLAYTDAVPAPLGRHGLRAGRPAGEQAALRHGVRAHAVLGQAVHGLGDAPAARAGHRRHGADPVRRRLPRGAARTS